jgi:hypothetical protein
MRFRAFPALWQSKNLAGHLMRMTYVLRAAPPRIKGTQAANCSPGVCAVHAVQGTPRTHTAGNVGFSVKAVLMPPIK